MGLRKDSLPWVLFRFIPILLILLQYCSASVRNFGRLKPGFQGSQMNWIDNDGLFLLSNDSTFGFGFIPTDDKTSFILGISHMSSSTIVWSANRGSLVSNYDKFVFDDGGNAYLQRGDIIVWSTKSEKKGVSSMQMQNTGNLVLIDDTGGVIWQSFSNPTNTLLSNQDFLEGMMLVSDPNPRNLTYILEIKSGDLILYAGYDKPQPYWSMSKDSRKTINKVGGDVNLASITTNSWRVFDKNKVLLLQFVFSDDTDINGTWVAILGTDGFLTFNKLQSGSSPVSSNIKIPNDGCSTPEPCNPYSVCESGNRCECPSVLASRGNCKQPIKSTCSGSNEKMELINAGDGLGYFALGFVSPSSTTDLGGCKSSCMGNCSCLAMFFDNTSGNCFMFDQIGSLQGSKNSMNIASYIKVSVEGGDSGSGNSNSKHLIFVIIIAIVTTFVILGLLYLGIIYIRKKEVIPDSPKDNSEEDNFLENISGMPVRFTYKELQIATNNFTVKLGQGGFGSVYQGVLKDGTSLAVKQLEGIGQGKKEFRAEVSIIGSIHHLHLVRLKGFCAEGAHRLLVYEYMANGSLDRWIFHKENGKLSLDWNTRYNIAVGTAKGLAYLHEDCDVKIVHCDIKPENVLLDDNFLAKVSDFGLAKLMTREQSHVFTTLRGTRGYLAPEWITNYAISEKSDVFSYGMVLLEIIGGRKNYDASEISEKSHFPSYAFKMMEEGKLIEIIDSQLDTNEKDERVMIAIKVALWCIQDDMCLRPPMTKVVQMLEGLCPVPEPPTSSQMGSRLYSNFFKSISSEGGSSSAPSDCNSDAYLSAVRLSGPR